MIDEKKLNEELGAWVVFEYLSCDVWVDPNGECHPYLNFTESLDLCFEYLVPKFREILFFDGVEFILGEERFFATVRYWYYAGKDSKGNTILDNFSVRTASAETPALAFCLAIKEAKDANREAI